MSTPRAAPASSSLPVSRALRIARVPLALAAIVYLAAAGYMGLYQRDFLYKRAPNWIAPESQGIPSAQPYRMTLPSTDGPEQITLSGWWVPPKRGDAPVFIYFHGNANGLDRRSGRFKLMTADGSGLIVLSYRGYGGSGGTPSEAAFHDDAEAIYREVAKTVPPERLVLFGESLGTGVALELATRARVRAVVLDSPYLSVLDRGQAEYPWLPVSLLLVDTFRSDRWIARSLAPVMILHGSEDRVIPPADSAKLAALGKPDMVRRKLYPGEAHVVPYDKGPGRDIAAFLASLAPISPASARSAPTSPAP